MSIWIAALLYASLGHAQSTKIIQNKADLHVLATAARASHQTAVRLTNHGFSQPVVLSLKEALEDYDLVLLQPVSKESVIENGWNIMTWYKTRILSGLSTAKPSPLVPSLTEVPTDILPHDLPASSQEMLLLYHGGTVTVDGVTFTKEVQNFPPLSLSNKYLCFLAVNKDGSTAIAPLGGSGVFEVSADGALHALGSDPHPLVDDIKHSFGNSLSGVSLQARKQQSTQK